jgi:hypothetical protein
MFQFMKVNRLTGRPAFGHGIFAPGNGFVYEPDVVV